MCRPTNRSRAAGPEIWFRIVHSALHGQNGTPVATYREQEVEVALGPMGIIEDGQVGILTRRVETDQLVNVVPLTRDNLKPPKDPKIPHVTELLRKALEWRRQLDAGEIPNLAEIARREGITRARVTQVMGMLQLTPEFQEQILSMADAARRLFVTERILRPIVTIANHHDQLREFQMLLV
jgi:hypothetical protein